MHKVCTLVLKRIRLKCLRNGRQRSNGKPWSFSYTVLFLGCSNPEKLTKIKKILPRKILIPIKTGISEMKIVMKLLRLFTLERLYDGIDNNCDGQIDEDVLVTYYFDADQDNFGDRYRTQQGCFPSTIYVTNGNDCDDSNGEIFLDNGNCDGVDNDCNESIDEGLGNDWYFDEDGDGYGAINTAVQTSTTRKLITTGGDCDDENTQIFPESMKNVMEWTTTAMVKWMKRFRPMVSR